MTVLAGSTDENYNHWPPTDFSETAAALIELPTDDAGLAARRPAVRPNPFLALTYSARSEACEQRRRVVSWTGGIREACGSWRGHGEQARHGTSLHQLARPPYPELRRDAWFRSATRSGQREPCEWGCGQGGEDGGGATAVRVRPGGCGRRCHHPAVKPSVVCMMKCI
eukprot:COSAG06_NODE_344_length_17074_cov_116.626510_8_plen_168_part_00